METDPSTHSSTIPPVTPPSSDGFLKKVFLKEEGLRAAWRLLVYAMFVAALEFSTEMWIWQFVSPEHGVFSFRNQFLHEVASFAAVFGAALIMSKLEKKPVGVYGLPVQGAFGGLFWQGCLFGFCEISAVVGLIAIFGGYSFGELALHGGELMRWGFLWAVFFVFLALFEEFLFRGYTQFTLTDGIGFWPAALVMSILFGAVHLQNRGENKIGVAGVILVGLFWCFTLRRTGSLWFAVGMHASFDFGETFLYSVPDSGMLFPGHLSNATLHGPAWLTGGTPGPEASVIDFMILAVFFYLFHRLHPAPAAKEQER